MRGRGEAGHRIQGRVTYTQPILPHTSHFQTHTSAYKSHHHGPNWNVHVVTNLTVYNGVVDKRDTAEQLSSSLIQPGNVDPFFLEGLEIFNYLLVNFWTLKILQPLLVRSKRAGTILVKNWPHFVWGICHMLSIVLD